MIGDDLWTSSGLRLVLRANVMPATNTTSCMQPAAGVLSRHRPLPPRVSSSSRNAALVNCPDRAWSKEPARGCQPWRTVPARRRTRSAFGRALHRSLGRRRGAARAARARRDRRSMSRCLRGRSPVWGWIVNSGRLNQKIERAWGVILRQFIECEPRIAEKPLPLMCWQLVLAQQL